MEVPCVRMRVHALNDTVWSVFHVKQTLCMEAVIEQVGVPANSSFHLEVNDLPHFTSSWHYHDLYELIYVTQGTGTGFVGDRIVKFGPGTLAFIGPGLPHVWLNDKEYYDADHVLRAGSIVVKFRDDFVGQGFFDRPEMQRLRRLLEESGRGILFSEAIALHAGEELASLNGRYGFDRVLRWLGVLHELSECSDYELLASEGYVYHPQRGEDRIDKVYRYVMDNFQNYIPLEAVSAVANMSPTAFCRYFRSRTNRTFSSFLNEIRVGYACRLLIEGRLTTLEICYKCGFNYPSNFHKQFRKLMALTPLEYQKAYWKQQESISAKKV